MVAFVVSFAVTVGCIAAGLRLAKQRPLDATLTWGHAMLAATFVFFVLFMAYGVVPHQWLTWADNELNWRPDRLLSGPGAVFEKLPFDLTYLVLRDAVVSAIYGGFLVAQVVVWKLWQTRGRAGGSDQPELETSPFGRPLVKLVKKA